MLKLTIRLTRAFLLVLWVACILSLLSLIPQTYGQPVLMLGTVVLLLHFIEYLLVRSKVAKRQGGKTGFIGTMVFGFGYWLPLLRATTPGQ
jgi:uncharacterized protein YhhL (DUF1145 family)